MSVSLSTVICRIRFIADPNSLTIYIQYVHKSIYVALQPEGKIVGVICNFLQKYLQLYFTLFVNTL